MNSISLIKKNTLAAHVGEILFFTLLLVCAAYVRIPLPFTPVPLTLQTLVVYFAIGKLRERAVFVQLAYLALGILGLPVFTNSSMGIGYLLGPTGGYLAGFLLASVIFGNFMRTSGSLAGRILRYVGIAVLIYACGAAGLIAYTHCSLFTALQLGVLPFMAGEILKLSIAIGILKK
ncbi:MAG: biotin transporter BioY [Caldisericia bacterium]|nr:biotin transporter BioY [Caldisericia bacterium]